MTRKCLKVLLLTTGKCPHVSYEISKFVVVNTAGKCPSFSFKILVSAGKCPEVSSEISGFAATDSAVKYCDVAPTISSFVAAKMT